VTADVQHISHNKKDGSHTSSKSCIPYSLLLAIIRPFKTWLFDFSKLGKQRVILSCYNPKLTTRNATVLASGILSSHHPVAQRAPVTPYYQEKPHTAATQT
jgi:hypothetical protein